MTDKLIYVVTATMPYECTNVIGVFSDLDAAKACTDSANGQEDYLYSHAVVRSWSPDTGKCVDDDVYWKWLREESDHEE
jgi:hypothetical protein